MEKCKGQIAFGAGSNGFTSGAEPLSFYNLYWIAKQHFCVCYLHRYEFPGVY